MVVKIFDWLVRMAPSSALDLRGQEARETFREVCNAAKAAGPAAYVMEASRELLNIAAVIGAAYFSNMKFPKMRWSGVGRDVRMAARSLRAGGAATAIAMATLALGIGINAAIFSVLDAVIFTDVPFRDHARFVEITNFDARQKMSFAGTSRQVVTQWQTQTDLFDRVEAYQAASLVYESNGSAEMISGAGVTPGLFELLGVRPALGRPFASGDGETGGPPIVIVNDAFWRKALGGTPDLSHAKILIDGREHAVIGVMPPTFRFPTGAEQVWTPYDLNHPPDASPIGRSMTPFARLAKGVTRETAERQARTRGSRLNDAAGWDASVTASVWQAGRGVDDKTTRSLWVLSGAVGFLFLIVCANVANLALTRTLSRTREMATCAALGASPGDLLRAAILEHALLAAASTMAGALIAAGAIRVAIATLPDAMTSGTMNVIDLDGRALLFMIAAGAVAAILFGLPPALLAYRGSISQVLGGDSRTTSGSKTARRIRSALVIGEVAVSAVLLIGGAMMTRSFIQLTSVDQGFDPAELTTIRLGLPAAGYSDVHRRDLAADDVAARLASLPYVRSATVGPLPKDHGKIAVGTLEFERDPNRTTGRVVVPVHEVQPNYFSTIGMKITDGRTFDSTDPSGAVVVSARFAQKYFDGNAVGQRFRFAGKPWRYVVGVSANTAPGEGSFDGQLAWYCPIGDAGDAYVMSRTASKIADFRNILVRTSHTDELLAALPAAVGSVDGSIVIWKTARVEDELAVAIARPRIVFVLLSVFAAFGLLLAMAGLYGVLSVLVAQRRQELGVRLALGATASGVRRLVMGSGLAYCGIGIVLGLAAAIPLVRLTKTLLYEVNPSDPFAIAGAITLLMLTAVFACWWPARDAAKTDPTVLLRRD
jgi:putative ABC transport system permease protein